MASSQDRHGQLKGPKIEKHHKRLGVISPRAKEGLVGITKDMVKARPMTGGEEDTERVRLIRNFYSELPEELFTYQEIVKEVDFSFALNIRNAIEQRQVPDDRTFIIDDVYFFATVLAGGGFVPSGSIGGAVQPYFEIGGIVPVEISAVRAQPGLSTVSRAYFPIFNDRVGAREVTFSLYAKRGRTITAYYINRVVPPVPLRTIGVRIEGWLVDSNAFEEILEQQL